MFSLSPETLSDEVAKQIDDVVADVERIFVEQRPDDGMELVEEHTDNYGTGMLIGVVEDTGGAYEHDGAWGRVGGGSGPVRGAAVGSGLACSPHSSEPLAMDRC